MGYRVEFLSAHLPTCGPKKVWDLGVYGLSQAWVMGVMTVVSMILTV